MIYEYCNPQNIVTPKIIEVQIHLTNAIDVLFVINCYSYSSFPLKEIIKPLK